MLDTLKEVYSYLMTHGPAIVAIVGGLIGVAEVAVRLTKTEKDDGAVQRIGGFLRKAFDYVKVIVPNNKAGGGQHEDQVKKEGK